MTFRSLYRELNLMYPESLRCEWDNDGIMCMPYPDADVKKVLISLDVTEDVVDFAISNCFDTIVSHHPLIFKSQQSLSIDKYTQRKLIKLVKANINVMSFHTRLDAAQGGVNDTLCKVLSFDNFYNDSTDPIGRIAELSNSITIDEFASLVKDKLCSPFILLSGSNPVKKIYVCGGDGKDMISNVISNGADTLLTGRASYNTMIDAKDMGINIVEAGHFFTENPVCTALESRILSFDSSIKTQIFESNNIKVLK